MLIHVKVNTSAKNPSIKLIDGIYVAKLKVVREKGKANEKLIGMLADYFNVSKSQVEIIHGEFSSIKVVRIG